MALHGQSASFQAGGTFPVPVVTGATLSGLQGVQFVPFGVQLSFTPTITDKDRIRLIVSADVSTKDLASSACETAQRRCRSSMTLKTLERDKPESSFR